ncbi:GNAT family N-acetyltransferase [Clostridium estertheticum]|uniref:GNAT family N-acetyltransferase n=1 Tax=Clostridium estertheticum TaxID=238834 RepID=UPI001C0CB3BC|nr:GNAT family N-acetyltransferase [Clostridium estertheticum]MBU3171925.1 GNAT family N-acetyltransferase [Clostridium estertheticum]
MEVEIIIRDMEESDLQHVLSLRNIDSNSVVAKNFYKKEVLMNYLKRNSKVSSVACTFEGKIIGFLLCGHDGIRGFIYNITVSNEYEIRRISKMMVTRSLSELKKLELILVLYLPKVAPLT